MSHPPNYSGFMKRNIQPAAPASLDLNRVSGTPRKGRSSLGVISSDHPKSEGEAVENGLLGLCHEIAGLILRRHIEKNDAVAVRREVRGRLVQMMQCSEERAERLIDLSLELIHVKIHGRFKRNSLELSLLIARAANQLREVGDN